MGLFVYGTLQPGCANEHVLKKIDGSFTKATLTGFTFDTTWEKQTGYPGLIAANKNAKVTGFLFTANDLAKHWNMLDAFETEAYQRIETFVTLENKTQVPAFVYIINLNVDPVNL